MSNLESFRKMLETHGPKGLILFVAEGDTTQDDREALASFGMEVREHPFFPKGHVTVIVRRFLEPPEDEIARFIRRSITEEAQRDD